MKFLRQTRARRRRLAVAWAMVFPAVAFAAETPPKPAETPAAKSSAVPGEPAMTTATYGDWTLRCQRVGEGDNAAKVCEVAQTIQIQGQQAPIAQVAIGHAPPKGLHATIVLPTNISLPSVVHLGGDDPKEKSLDLAWTRCLPGGCYADAMAPDDLVASWRAASKPLTLKFVAANGQKIEFPLSVRGLPQALDALAKQ